MGNEDIESLFCFVATVARDPKTEMTTGDLFLGVAHQILDRRTHVFDLPLFIEFAEYVDGRIGDRSVPALTLGECGVGLLECLVFGVELELLCFEELKHRA